MWSPRGEKEVKSQSVRTRCSLEELCEWEQAQEKNKESKRKYTVRKRAVSEERVCPVVFPFKKKGFPHKFLYSCVVVLLLCLLEFIHSYVEFFPTQLTYQYHTLIDEQLQRNLEKWIKMDSGKVSSGQWGGLIPSRIKMWREKCVYLFFTFIFR